MIWIKRIVITIVILTGLLLFVVLPIGGSFLITNSRFHFPERGPQRAADVGLDVENVDFTSKDGISLKGWWNSGEDDNPVIIFCHGLNRSRLEMLERAAEARKRGYGVLLFDMRNHGASGNAYTTLGIHEANDVCAAGDVVRKRAPGRRELLWGVSLGASTALLAVKQCDGFSGVVSDSAFVSFRDTISHHFQLYFHLPAFPIANMIIALTGWRMGINPDDGDVEAAIKTFGAVPLLVIAGGRDRRMPPNVAQKLYDASTSPLKQFLLIPDATHGEAFRTDRERYLDAVFRFFAIIRGDSKGSARS
jgi:alpha-beta hydrolase superfamily lysophospholipase